MSALDYAAAGWAVIPLHTPDGEGRCDCRRADCPSIGKHPRTMNGLRDATADAATVSKWWDMWPTSNIGLVVPPDVVVVDIDGPEGTAALAAAGVEMPETATVQTGRGWHYLYRTSRPIAPTVGLFQHVDLRGPGSYIVAPPSRHANGTDYRWRRPLAAMTDAPAWLYERAQRAPAPAVGDAIPAGRRNATLASLAGSMRRRGMAESAIVAALMAENAERCSPPLPESEVRAVAASVARYEPAPERATPPPGETALARVGARSLDAIDRSPAPPLIVNRISPDGHTILFGPGNVGKGLLASSWIVQHVQAGGRVLILDFEDHPEEWARRVWGLGGAAMLGADAPIRHVSPLRLGMPRWPLLADAAREHQADLIVIDSLAYAIPGADPSDPQAATAYSAAIQPFGVPVLSLAHMNRAGDDRYPFGSVFWHAGARITWSLVPDGPDTAKLTSRKHNNYEWQGAYSVTSDWLDDEPRVVSERTYSATVAERIAEALPGTLDELTAALAEDGAPVKRNTIVQALRRGLRDERYTLDGETWRMKA